MEQQPTRAHDARRVIAPDGIAVHPIKLPGLARLSLAEGRLPRGQYGVHAHYTLEQITYVLSGRLRVTMGGPETRVESFECVAGDTICTAPLTTLSYENPGPEEARVLFICSPAYPADNSDTITLDQHRGFTRAELKVASTRQRVVSLESHAEARRRQDTIVARWPARVDPETT